VQITSHHSISLSPAWSPSGKTVSYTSFAYHPGLGTRNPDLFTYDIFAGKRFLVSSRIGINSGSTFSPDGKFIYLTISKGGDPNIYRMTLEGDDLTPITHASHGALYVEPNVSPDGSKIAFSSDKDGNPMIYTMSIIGTDVKRITYAGHYNSSPSFSPDGKKLAFAGQDKDHFDIFTVNLDGTDMQRLTSAKKPNGRMANNEDPSWSPDGRHLVFTSDRTGTNQIFIISADGTNERRITVDKNNYYKARWSPYLE
jgi:TolB protein